MSTLDPSRVPPWAFAKKTINWTRGPGMAAAAADQRIDREDERDTTRIMLARLLMRQAQFLKHEVEPWVVADAARPLPDELRADAVSAAWSPNARSGLVGRALTADQQPPVDRKGKGEMDVGF